MEHLEPSASTLRLFGRPSDAAGLEWSWVDTQLAEAGTYWVVAPGGRCPHPRPVWGAWYLDRLHLSIGSPVIGRLAVAGTPIAVHLDSGTDVVIVEGRVVGANVNPDVVAAYNHKYAWDYSVDEFGPLTTIAPVEVLAWRTAGWAGRESFQSTGRWTYPRR